MTQANLILGALIADAAARGLHWLYDPERIAQVAARAGSPAFVPIDPANYANAKGIGVHAAGTDGEQTQYGHALMLALGVTTANGGFDTTAYQTAYTAHFGPGGTYVGYVDRPTRGTLENLAATITEPSGIDDDQMPTLATLPAVVAAHHERADFDDSVQNAIAVTNVNDDARLYGGIAANLMRDVLNGTSLTAALDKAAQTDLLRAALDTSETDPVAYGEVTNRACHLPQGMPLAFHILARADSYTQAVEWNIAAGGDSAGRSMLIGAVAGAAFGMGGAKGIPLGWLMQTKSATEAVTLLGV